MGCKLTTNNDSNSAPEVDCILLIFIYKRPTFYLAQSLPVKKNPSHFFIVTPYKLKKKQSKLETTEKSYARDKQLAMSYPPAKFNFIFN